jgi:hypothetical protein
MALVRSLIVAMLVAAGICFALYAGTGQPRYKQLGLVILKWTLMAAFAFFAGLIVERLFLSE